MEVYETEIVVALIAVVASFVGLVISKEQKTSEFRQAWIGGLRDDISKFIGEADRVRKLILINKSSAEDEKQEASSAVIKESVELRRLKSKIELLINPGEIKHADLVRLLERIIGNLKLLADNTEVIDELTGRSQEVLKQEWNRVKAGEPFFKISKWIFGLVFLIMVGYLVYGVLCV